MIKKRLSYRILIFILFLIGGVFTAVGILTYSLSRDMVLKSALDRATLQSNQVAREVDYIFENAKLNTFQMSLNRDVRTYLKEVASKEDIYKHPLYEFVFEYLVEVKESNPMHFLAWVANERANFYLDSSKVVPDTSYRVVDRPWYDVALQSFQPTFTEPYIEWNTGKLVISSIYALREEEEVYGFVVVDIMLDQVPYLLSEMKTHENDLTFLVSSSGDYLFHPDIKQVMSSNIYDYDDALNPYLSYIADGQNVKRIDYAGRQYYMMSNHLAESNWTIISLIEVSALESEISSLMFRIMFLMVFAFLLLAVGVVWHVNRHTSPYKLLVDFAENIEKGDYNKDIPENYLNKGDEMGAICQSFQRIINRFREEHSELSETIKYKDTEIEKQYEYIYQTEKSVTLGHIVAGVAHEINTPLGVSITLGSHVEELYTESLKKLETGTMTREDLKRYFNQMDEAIPLLNHNLSRAATLVKSFKQIAVDQFTEAKQNFNLNDVIKNVVTSLKSEYKQKNITFNVNCDSELIIYGEPGIYAQITTNFVMNAIQHGFKYKTGGNIFINCEKKDTHLHLIFKDDGVGISPENQKKIYDPFFTTNREKGNSGLGMNIVLNLITQKLGGTLEIDSKEGEYTCFLIKIPY